MIRIRKLLFVFSLIFNLLFLLFFLFALSHKTASVSFYAPPGPPERLTAAALATVPGSGSIVFTTVELDLKKGEAAALQFSAVSGGRQVNLLINALYDHTVVSVEQTGFGVLITALAPGEAVMQTLGEEGFRDLARITVRE
jgi:hypothetical protein